MKKTYEKHFEFGGQMMNYCKKLLANKSITYIFITEDICILTI